MQSIKECNGLDQVWIYDYLDTDSFLEGSFINGSNPWILHIGLAIEIDQEENKDVDIILYPRQDSVLRLAPDLKRGLKWFSSSHNPIYISIVCHTNEIWPHVELFLAVQLQEGQAQVDSQGSTSRPVQYIGLMSLDPWLPF